MYQKECSGCGKSFTTSRYSQKLCKRWCGRTGANQTRAFRRSNNDIEFVGVDGEGVDRPDGSHEYVMLSVGDNTLFDGGYALSLKSILQFLWENYKSKPSAAFVGFFLGYDFIQWLKQLPEDRARLLFTTQGIAERKSAVKVRANPYPDAVVWEGWEIDIMAGRRFKLRPHVCVKSRWKDVCRNRTCQRKMEVAIGEPAYILPDEMLFIINDDVETEEYMGDPIKFWAYHTRYMHAIDGVGKGYGWMYVCDTGPFWQTSFLNVINPKVWDGREVCTTEEYGIVKEGKANREQVWEKGRTDYFESMRKYNVLENDILGRVTTRLNEGFMNDRIPIKIPKADWYGPGRAAQIWMDQLHELCCDQSARQYNKSASKLERKNELGLLNADVYMSMPTWFYEASQASYYGGWFEPFMHGHIGNSWEYDLNSAYPYIIASLPCLHTTGNHNGVYSRGEGDEYPRGESVYTLLNCKVSGTDPYIGAMPYRNKAGLISRPQQTKGWYWEHEISAAIRAGVIDTVEVEEWVSYNPCACRPPFNPEDIGIEALYELRLEFGKNTPQGKSAKLTYNSAYGKTAQSIGDPKYSNPVHASLITAGCRTLILEAIGTHPMGTKGVAMVATDGVYFLERHDRLELDAVKLGAWDEQLKENLTIFMSGVYWDERTRNAVHQGEPAKLKSRGVSGRDLSREIERLDSLFAYATHGLKNGVPFQWPCIVLRTGFLLDSCKNALARGKWNTAGRVTHGAERTINSEPGSKRDVNAYYDDEWGVVRTRPIMRHNELKTTPYRKSFGYLEHVEGMNGMFGDSVGRDGDDGMQYWKELINGT